MNAMSGIAIINIKSKLFLAIFLLLTGIHADAQQQISGMVHTEKGKPIADVNVIASSVNDQNKVYSYSITDDEGKYSLNLNTQEDSLKMIVTGFNIAPHTYIIPSKTPKYDITVKEEAQQIKEVVVKAKKIYSNGDTINYNVSAYSSANDFSLADVLKRMPGISVNEAGAISVKGKPIEHLYIEGMDMMKDRYGVATNSLDPNNIATVQVMENHQDIKALKEFTPSDKASINLKLKRGAKNVLNIIGTLGAGYDNKMLWDNSLITTLFRRNSQFFVTYKGNNTGNDLSHELQSFDDDDAPSQAILTDLTFPASPAISKEKYYFNRSHSLTYNNVYRLAENQERGINAVYSYEHENRNGLTTERHLLNDNSIYSIHEEDNGKMHSHMIYGDINYTLNKEKHYIKEQVKFDYQHENGFVNTFNKMNIAQQGDVESYSVLNSLHIVDRTADEKGFEFTSKTSWAKNPHSIQVFPNLFSDDSTNTEGLNQHVEMRSFDTKNDIMLIQAFTLGKLLLSPVASVKYRHDNLNSNLHGLRTNSSYENLLTMDDLKTGINLNARLNLGNFEFNGDFPMAYRYLSINQEKSTLNDHISRMFFEPDLNVCYKIDTSNDMTLSAGICNSVPSIDHLYCQPVLTSYRSLAAYSSSDLFISRTYHYGYSYNFKDIFNMLFMGLDISYNHGCPKMLYGSEYKGDIENITSKRTTTAFNNCDMTIKCSKGFDWKKLKVSLSAGYLYFDQPLLLQDEECLYKGHTFTINSDIEMQPFPFCDLTYDVAYENCYSGMQGGDAIPRMTSLSNKIKADISTSKNSGVIMKCYHFYDDLNDDNKNFIMADAELYLTIKHVRFSLACNNLLNKTTYRYSRISDLSTYRYTNNIRPRSILFKIRFKIL